MDEDEATRKEAVRRDALLREMERKSLDTIMVYNPTSKDYMLEWDKRYHRIPARDKNMGFGPGKMELSRYLAEKYAREMKNQLINMQADEFMTEFRQNRTKAGQPFRDKFEENTDAIPLVPKTNDVELIKKIYNNIILGVVREYGMDMPDEVIGESFDTRTPEEAALENLNRPYTESDPFAEEPQDVPAVKAPTGRKTHPAAEVAR